MPAGYLVPIRGKLPSDPVHLRYLAAPIFVGTKEDGLSWFAPLFYRQFVSIHLK
jgi:hypothetical protein